MADNSDDELPPELESLYNYNTETKGNKLILVQTNTSTNKESPLELNIGDCIRFIRRPNNLDETISAKIIGFLKSQGGEIRGIQYLPWKPQNKRYANPTVPPRAILLDDFSPLGDYKTIKKVNCNEQHASYSLVKSRISSTIIKNKGGKKRTKKYKLKKRGPKKQINVRLRAKRGIKRS